MQSAAPARDEVRSLFERLQPTLPVVLANLVNVGQVAVTYRDNIEQLLVLFPTGTEEIQAVGVANRDTKLHYKGAFLSFNLNLNIPPTCTTGFLPHPEQRRPTSTIRTPGRRPVLPGASGLYPQRARRAEHAL